MNQIIEYNFLRRNLTLENMPMLRLWQIHRMKENIQAGLELGISREESYRMAVEDFASPAEKMVMAEMKFNLQFIGGMDEAEHQQMRLLMLINGWNKPRR